MRKFILQNSCSGLILMYGHVTFQAHLVNRKLRKFKIRIVKNDFRKIQTKKVTMKSYFICDNLLKVRK